MDQFSFNPFHLITENPALKWHCSILHLHKMILVIFYHYYQCGVNSIIKHFVLSQLADNILSWQSGYVVIGVGVSTVACGGVGG